MLKTAGFSLVHSCQFALCLVLYETPDYDHFFKYGHVFLVGAGGQFWLEQKISILLYRVFVKTTTLLIRAHSDGRGGGGGGGGVKLTVFR